MGGGGMDIMFLQDYLPRDVPETLPLATKVMRGVLSAHNLPAPPTACPRSRPVGQAGP